MTELRKQIESLAVESGKKLIAADHSSLQGVRITTKTGRRDLVTSMDLEIQRFLMTKLVELVPGCRFLCEEYIPEMGDVVITDPKEIDRGTCFIIDPIDGTANFVHGNRHSCTSIAMTTDGVTQIGVIYDPYRDELFSAAKGKGSFLNGEKLPVYDCSMSEEISVFGTAPYDDSTNKPTFDLGLLLYEMSADVRRTGSAALDCCWTACGRFGLYAELSLSAWDFAAGKLIAEEAGCLVSDIHGRPLSFHGKPSILCGRPTAVSEFLKEYKG
ncbi:MAG: inositol monophosphatase family protein [Bacillota bacterium]|nr:inositol monophosphatase family protein [Bacillota bacterium]